MKYKLVKLVKFRGSKSTIYSVIIDEDKQTLFDRFVDENRKIYPLEFKSIRDRLLTIATKTGAREQYFKLFEGKPGDGVCALYDSPESKLRLYCIKYGSCTIIIGGGGFKPKGIKALQDDKKLNDENSILCKLSALITNALRDGTIKWVNNGYELEGDLTFTDNEENE